MDDDIPVMETKIRNYAKASAEQLEKFLVSYIKWADQMELTEKELWLSINQHFSEWTDEHLKLVDKSAKQWFRDAVVQRGIYLDTDSEQPYGDQLLGLFKQTSYHEWTEAEITTITAKIESLVLT